jgi:WD40 repeat protein
LSRNLSRRELLVTGAVGGAALALPLPEGIAAVRRKQPRDSVHCLPAPDRFRAGDILTDCTFAAYASDGVRIALATSRGIEVLNRDDGTRVAVTPPGFTLSSGAWHPDGNTLIVSGPAADGSGPYLHTVTAAGLTRLLPAHSGPARAAYFSPDGRKVAFTYLNRYLHMLCMADWTGSVLANPRNLLPVDPATEPDLERVMAGLAWYETRGFSPDGTRFYFASDRGAGMINVSIHMLDLASRKRSRVTYDEGVAEGAVISPDGQVLYTGTTRARDPAFLTMVSGPGVPPFLGFVATPTLHDVLAAKRLALIGNGDVLRMDSTYGLRARIVGNRKKLAKKLNAPVPGGTYRVIPCSMSPDGTELAVAMISAVGSNVIVLERSPRVVPPPVAVGRTRRPPGSIPLSPNPLSPFERTMPSRRGGHVRLRLEGEVSSGSFEMEFTNFSSDGVFIFGGSARFDTRDGGFQHVADVRHVAVESQEEERVFYTADMQVDWSPNDVDPPVTGGSIASNSRSGDVAAAWDGTTFAPLGKWKAGNRGPRPVPGALPCRRAGGS